MSEFVRRHIGISRVVQSQLLESLNFDSIDEFVNKIIPKDLQELSSQEIELSASDKPFSEVEIAEFFKKLANKNKVYRNYIGCGYYNTHLPAVIKRNILENPGFYTQYTPYQAEIAQGRLEALLNFQTMVSGLTGLPVANASLLDEGTAAAEAMYMALSLSRRKKFKAETAKFFVDLNVFPQTFSVLSTRAKSLGIEIVLGDYRNFTDFENVFACFVQFPGANGELSDYSNFIKSSKEQNCFNIMACDLLASCLFKSAGEFSADIAIGSAQRFGLPLGCGGPHPAFLACTKDFERMIPGRIVGVSRDRFGNPAYRLSIQTREQHIRREKATSNICTAQVLPAVIAAMYAAYHGAEGIKAIAEHVHERTSSFADFLRANGFEVMNQQYFDTITIRVDDSALVKIQARAEEKQINLGYWRNPYIVIAFDETTRYRDLQDLAYVFTGSVDLKVEAHQKKIEHLARQSAFLEEEVFHAFRSETEMLRYIKSLENKDLSLVHSMIPLGSCTMKLNASSEMQFLSWQEFAEIHPFAPEEQKKGYNELFAWLEQALMDLTGFDACSLQPNAGSQGEYAGLLAIKAFHEANGDTQRDVCLIPASAHGTNPASAVIAGYQVVNLACDDQGNISLSDLEQKIAEYQDRLAALMITYPSTHGVFEEGVRNITERIHQAGGQVYLDGANLNAMVGILKPKDLGVDVMHINLHKTFCIPHGGGGPGVGPIVAGDHLAKFFPGHPFTGFNEGYGPIAAAPYGSASILTISLAYILMMGSTGLKRASQVALLSANYIAQRLQEYYPVLYRGEQGYVAHECIIDCRKFKQDLGIEVEDIAKRLMDYGFHAPTVSWPVTGCLMIEPTESESRAEIDRFCEAMIAIYQEIQKIYSGEFDRQDNPLKMSPHTLEELIANEWQHAYSREEAGYPLEYLRKNKFWPSVARIDAVFGDRNLVCSCS